MRGSSQHNVSIGETSNQIVDPAQEAHIVRTVRPPISATTDNRKIDTVKVLCQATDFGRTMEFVMRVRHIAEHLQSTGPRQFQVSIEWQLDRKQPFLTGISLVTNFFH